MRRNHQMLDQLIKRTTPQLFQQLSEASIDNMLAHSTLKKIDRTQVLVHQGDSPHYVYLIMAGLVKTTRMSADGNEAIVCILEPGDTCMEAVIFMGGVSPVNVQALAATTILQIPSRIVKTLILEDAQFALNLLHIISGHYKNTMQHIDTLVIKSPLQRVGYYLLLKHLQQGVHKLDFKIPIKKNLIANYLGMTPETLSRSLKKLGALGIQVDDYTISLHDYSALCQFCDADTASMCPQHNTPACKVCTFH